MAEVGYRLGIGGQAAPPDLLDAVQRIEVEEHATMGSIMRLSIAVAVDESGDGWTVLDEGLFSRLTELTMSITIGAGEPEPVLTAYVIETRTVLSETPGESLLEVVAMDATVLLNLEEKVRRWPNTADSDIATSILDEHGLVPVVDRAEPTRDEADVVPIQRATDMQFLAALAARHGFDVFVRTTADGVEGHFHAPRLDEPPQGVLTVGFAGAGNVPELTVTHDALRPTAVRGEHLAADSFEPQTAAVDAVSLADLGGRSVLGGDRPRTLLLERTGVTDTAGLQTFAQAVADRSSWAVRAEGEVRALRYEGLLQTRRPVVLRGAGRTLSGTYYVERVLHTFDEEGYRQRFTLLRNALGLSGREDFSDNDGLPT